MTYTDTAIEASVLGDTPVARGDYPHTVWVQGGRSGGQRQFKVWGQNVDDATFRAHLYLRSVGDTGRVTEVRQLSLHSG